jgi:hypothetical protein
VGHFTNRNHSHVLFLASSKVIDEFSMLLTMAFFTSAAAIGEKNQRQKVFDHREMGRCHEDMFGFLFEDGLSFFLKTWDKN